MVIHNTSRNLPWSWWDREVYLDTQLEKNVDASVFHEQSSPSRCPYEALLKQKMHQCSSPASSLPDLGLLGSRASAAGATQAGYGRQGSTELPWPARRLPGQPGSRALCTETAHPTQQAAQEMRPRHRASLAGWWMWAKPTLLPLPATDFFFPSYLPVF